MCSICLLAALTLLHSLNDGNSHIMQIFRVQTLINIRLLLFSQKRVPSRFLLYLSVYQITKTGSELTSNFHLFITALAPPAFPNAAFWGVSSKREREIVQLIGVAVVSCSPFFARPRTDDGRTRKHRIAKECEEIL